MELEKIKQIISSQFNVKEDEITVDTKMEDLDADSLDIVEFIMAVEEEFDITVDEAAAQNFTTVGDVLNYVKGSAN